MMAKAQFEWMVRMDCEPSVRVVTGLARNVQTCERHRLETRTFFFQAEDGIRAKLVTGVQTCALPIWFYRTYPPLTGTIRSIGPRPSALTRTLTRSEERRVGKECKTRRAPN